MEEEFTVARLYISKMRSEVKNLAQRCSTLETAQSTFRGQIDEREKELNECKLLITQHEAKMKSLSQSMKDGESKKRSLEEQVDSLNEEVARLKAVSKVSEQDGHIKEVLEKQIDEHREQHQKQVCSYTVSSSCSWYCQRTSSSLVNHPLFIFFCLLLIWYSVPVGHLEG